MASQITVTATLQDPSGSALQGNAFVRFRLRNFQGFVPVVAGTSIICETQIDALPDVSGNISQLLWSNNNITPATTFYTVEFHNQARITSSGNYLFNGNTNLNTASQLNTPPVPAGFSLVLEHNGTLNSSQNTLNLESTDSSISIVDMGAGTLNLRSSGGGGGISGNFLETHGWSGGTLQGSSVLNQNNANFGVIGNTTQLAFVSPTATELGGLVIGQLSTDSSAGAFNDFNTQITLGTLKDYLVRFQLGTTTNTRMWVGISDVNQGSSNFFNQDVPNFNFVGFRYSNGLDTHWSAVTISPGGPGFPNVSVVDTGILPDTTASHKFEIVPSGSNVTFYIDGNLVATIAANIPANSTAMRGLNQIDRKGTSSNVNATLMYGWWATNKI